MGFELFSQPRGPDVIQSLFGDAATAGIRAGNALPTGLTAAIQGAQQGYQLGQQEYSQDLVNQVREHQIEQFPIQDALDRARLKAQEQENQINALKLDTDIKTQDLHNEATINALKAENLKATQATTDLNNQKVIDNTIASGNVQAIQGMISNPSLAQTIFRSKETAATFAGKVSPYLTEEQNKRLFSQIDFIKDRELKAEQERVEAKIREQLGEKADKDQNTVVTGRIGWLMNHQNVATYPEVIKRVTTTPLGDAAGNYQVKLDGKNALADDGKPLIISNEENTAFTNQRILHKDWLNQPPEAKDAPVESAASTNGSPPVSPEVAGALNKYEELAKNPPTGLDRGTLDERLAAKKEAIKKMQNASPAQAASPKKENISMEMNKDNVQSFLSFLEPTSAYAEEFTPEERSAAPSSAKVLSNAVGQDVKLTPQVSDALSKNAFNDEVYKRVNDDPIIGKANALIKGMVSVESQGKRNAVSPTGVRGILQVTKATAAQYGLNRDIPEENIKAGSMFLADQLVRFNGDLRLALTAYNAGPGTVLDAVREAGSTEWKDVLKSLKDNLSAAKFKEVENYANKVIAAASHFVNPKVDADKMFVQLLLDNNLVEKA